MSVNKELVTAIAKFGEALAKLWHQYLKSRDKIRMSKAIDYGERYIRCNEDEGKYKGQSPKKKLIRLGVYREGLFKYNN